MRPCIVCVQNDCARMAAAGEAAKQLTRSRTRAQVIELTSGGADALVGYWGAVVGLWLQAIEIVLLLALLYFFVG